MIKNGLVIAVENGTAEVTVEECEECRSCGACSLFGKRPSIRVEASNLNVGDHVMIEVAPGMVKLGTMLVFTLPCVAFLLGAALSVGLARSFGIKLLASDAAMALVGAVAVAATLVIVRVIDRRLAQREPVIRIVDIQKAHANGKDDR